MDDAVQKTTALAPLTIDVVSDAVCPWCFVGKRKLEAALALCPDIAVDIRWRPFQLDPTIPQGGLDRNEYILKKFGPERIGKVNERLVEIGHEVGIDFAFDKIKRSPNTLDAHRLIRWAQEAGRQTELVERLFEVYFLEGGDIGDLAVLAGVADEVGLDGAAIRRRLDSSDDFASIEAEIVAASRIGVTGVPFYIFGGALGASGAQSPDVLVAAMRQALNPPPEQEPA